MASARAGVITANTRRSSKLSSYIETMKIAADRDLVKILNESKREAKEGNGVPLRSLR